MQFKIKDKIYPGDAVQHLTLAMIIELQTETAALGRMITMGDVEDMSTALEKVPKAKQKNHPDMAWMVAINVWAARKLAGESITFDEAIQLELADLDVIPEPQDRKVAVNPTKARPRKASGPATKRRQPAASSARTSKSPSTSA